jgi:toxin ParE1/3/4
VKPFKFHPAARREFREAIAFYDERAIGLGQQFTDEVESAIRRIRETSTTWPKISETVRCCFLHRFPYSVLYRESTRGIEIVAIMHQRRHPHVWKGR